MVTSLSQRRKERKLNFHQVLDPLDLENLIRNESVSLLSGKPAISQETKALCGKYKQDLWEDPKMGSGSRP